MKHGSFWSVSLLFASYCIWQVEISYPTSLSNIPIIYIFLKFQCVFCVLNFSVANTIISEESYFRMNVHWDIINVQRKQKGTKDSPLWDTRQNRGPILFCSVYNNSLLSVAQKRIYPLLDGMEPLPQWSDLVVETIANLKRGFHLMHAIC